MAYSYGECALCGIHRNVGPKASLRVQSDRYAVDRHLRTQQSRTRHGHAISAVWAAFGRGRQVSRAGGVVENDAQAALRRAVPIAGNEGELVLALTELAGLQLVLGALELVTLLTTALADQQAVARSD